MRRGSGTMLGRRARRFLRSTPYAVVSAEDDDGRFITLPVSVEAVTRDLVALRVDSSLIPPGNRRVCVCAHTHGEAFDRFRQVVVYGEALVRGHEVRITPRRALVSTRPPGIIGDLKAGLVSRRKSREALSRSGREPVSMDLLDRAFGPEVPISKSTSERGSG